jgi:small subunit ribosomal protein S18
MARNNDRDRGPKRVVRDNRPRGKRKVYIFCQERTVWVDYKDVNLLRRYMSDRGKIRSRRVTGNCAQHQREVQVAIKTAREVALLPYTQRTVTERVPGRGPRGTREDETRANRTDADGDLRDVGHLRDVSDLEDFDELERLDNGSRADGDELSAGGFADRPAAASQLQESEV